MVITDKSVDTFGTEGFGDSLSAVSAQELHCEGYDLIVSAASFKESLRKGEERFILS